VFGIVNPEGHLLQETRLKGSDLPVANIDVEEWSK
jgi:hypothetical protein